MSIRRSSLICVAYLQVYERVADNRWWPIIGGLRPFHTGVGYDAHWHLSSTVHYRCELNAHRERSLCTQETLLERRLGHVPARVLQQLYPPYCFHSSSCAQETLPEDEYTSVEDRETVDRLPSSHFRKRVIIHYS